MKTERKKAAPVSREEQYRLVMECRTSGLSDRQWCTEHGINPETFRNWVKKLRDKGTPGIPKSGRKREAAAPPASQSVPEIVKLPYERKTEEHRLEGMPAFTLELLVSGTHIRMTNEVSPEILRSVLRILVEASC